MAAEREKLDKEEAALARQKLVEQAAADKEAAAAQAQALKEEQERQQIEL